MDWDVFVALVYGRVSRTSAVHFESDSHLGNCKTFGINQHCSLVQQPESKLETLSHCTHRWNHERSSNPHDSHLTWSRLCKCFASEPLAIDRKGHLYDHLMRYYHRRDNAV